MHTILRDTDNRGVEYIQAIFNVEDDAKDVKAALQKRNQLEKEIRDGRPAADLLHTLSKMWMFAANVIPRELIEEAPGVTRGREGDYTMFTREELARLLTRARMAAETKGINPHWQRAYWALADAVDHLDAMIARSSKLIEDDGELGTDTL